VNQGSHSMVDAVIFDFGGVLTLSHRIWEEFRRYEGQLDLPGKTITMALGSGPAWREVSVGGITEEEYWEQVSAGFAERLPPAFNRFKHGTLPYEELNQEVVELIRSLREQTKIGLLSNATISLATYLEKLPRLSQLFDDMVISAAVGLRKPDIAIYELAAGRLGVDLGRALLVDDKERNVIAAREAGMLAVVFESAIQLRDALSGMGFDMGYSSKAPST